MRVTSDSLRLAFLDALQSAQRRLQTTQTQISTGRRVNVPSDDPFAAARIGELGAALQRIDQYGTNGTLAKNRLSLEEQTLASAADALQRVRELAVEGNNATLGDADRRAIVTELKQRLDGLVSLANTTDSAGRYLFAGYSENAQPFAVGAGGAVAYNGDDGQRLVEIADGRFVAIGDPGSAAFGRIPNGNGTFTLAAAAANTGSGVLGAGTVVDPTAYVAGTYTIAFTAPDTYEVRDGGGALVASGAYTAGQAIAFRGVSVDLSGSPAAGDAFTVAPSTNQDVFTTLSDLIGQLGSPAGTDASRAQLNSAVGQSLSDVDRALEHVVDLRAAIGSRLQALDAASADNGAFSTQMTDTLSALRDVDYPKAISLLTQQLTSLDAAQKSFAQTQGLSLFRYL